MEKYPEINYSNYSRRLPNVDILIIFILQSPIAKNKNNLTQILAFVFLKRRKYNKNNIQINLLFFLEFFVISVRPASFKPQRPYDCFNRNRNRNFSWSLNCFNKNHHHYHKFQKITNFRWKWIQFQQKLIYKNYSYKQKRSTNYQLLDSLLFQSVLQKPQMSDWSRHANSGDEDNFWQKPNHYNPKPNLSIRTQPKRETARKIGRQDLKLVIYENVKCRKQARRVMEENRIIQQQANRAHKDISQNERQNRNVDYTIHLRKSKNNQEETMDLIKRVKMLQEQKASTKRFLRIQKINTQEQKNYYEFGEDSKHKDE